ncbi:MAG: FAD-dependent oxidoreductase [Desulfobacterales bacterium]|jgi:NADPH-dependent glutamate synthase beta subunit-like oxidoreductase/glutamate synthase domain-containing protein 3/NAD-dependent dihydropyrimidine dehydrogenase PreA subunit|nr:FAD-dependent oxidoreductase [Desulfobacterales bacterium]
MMNDKSYHIILGNVRGNRLSTRVLEEQIQMAVSMGYRQIEVRAYGQHGIGGRLWKAGDEKIHIRITGHSGQRVGSFGYANTRIEVMGPASDDIGWLNAGAQIVVHGHAANGTANAMAQGKVYVAGNIGSRGMTMTKQNPRFDPPELWVLGSAGDYFGEFMAGGIAVICGYNPQTPKNVLGHRPLVGMVGGKVFFRGPHAGFSRQDAKLVPIDAADWAWLTENLKVYLEHIHRTELLDTLSDAKEWQLLVVRSPQEKIGGTQRAMHDFRKNVWDKELGEGGLIGDLTKIDRSPVPLIVMGELRRFVPVWENRKYLAPCEASCPTGMPVHERWRLVREGRVDEAVDLALAYTPFPATVCGYLCPNPCMSACTRSSSSMASVDVTQIGKASIQAKTPALPALKAGRIAVIGGGPAGISVAWQLRQRGYEAVVYDMTEKLGGKISAVIPESRIPKEVVAAELTRAREIIPHVHLQQALQKEDVERLRNDFDFIVVAVGAQKPRTIPIPGGEKMITALDFLGKAKQNAVKPGKRVIIIGAGNVGCDVATEAARLGAADITLIDVQEPASFGKERDEAEKVGAKFRWPCFTKEITDAGVVLRTGEVLPADTVIISIGDQPLLDFLPEAVAVERGFVTVNDIYRTTDEKIFAIGDAVKPGLITDAIGAGRKAAGAISDLLSGNEPAKETRRMIDRKRVTLEYFDPRFREFGDVTQCGAHCASCGACRDCGICVQICPETAIRRMELLTGGYEYVVDETRCIGCGFCAGACPCGVWDLAEGAPLS